jgi:cellulose synthase/poly-beta-1,6-N-acetylglucosamine synthase-like glycosyltransferase
LSLIGMLTSPRSLIFVIFLISFIIWLIVKKSEKEYSERYHSVDAVIPAYNEEITIAKTIIDLAANKYINRIIAVDDGSTDRTGEVLSGLKSLYKDKLTTIISQSNTGKAGAINNGLNFVNSEMVFLTDADIRIPDDNGLGYLIKAIENGADAAAGIPGSDLNNICFFGKIRASVKIFFATFRKCGAEIISGHPFCVSGSVGMYKTRVLKSVGFSGRTSVEDMDLTWELISRGYKIAQSSRAIVFSQEAATFGDEIKRWRRWISGYAACMRIHKKLLLKRFGLTTILPGFIIGVFGVILFSMPFTWGLSNALTGAAFWLVVLIFASGYSAYKQGRKWWLMVYSPLSVFLVFLVFVCWMLWGLPTLVTGSQQNWMKVKRY